MKRFLLLIAITLCFYRCSEDAAEPVILSAPDCTVYLAGNAGEGGYWKNEVYNMLGEGYAQVNSMSVDDTVVVIGGWTFDQEGEAEVTVWKNGVEEVTGGTHTGGVTFVAARNNELYGVWNEGDGWILYKNGIKTPISPRGWPTGIALLNGDVYIVGSSQGNEHPWGSAFYSLDTYTQCWRNDEVIFRDSVYSYANTIFIHQNDIYLGGHRNHYPLLDRVACYWKNGQRIELTTESEDAEVRSLFVTDTQVYAAGSINGKAAYWKDGAAVVLSNGVTNSMANSISVLGTDVYIAGQEGKYPAVWKNGIKQTFPNQEKEGAIEVVIAVSN
jgi:hypothetical protein